MAALNRGGFEVGMVVWSLEDLNKTDPDGFERSDFDSPEALDHPALVIRVRGPPVTDKDKGGILICTVRNPSNATISGADKLFYPDQHQASQLLPKYCSGQQQQQFGAAAGLYTLQAQVRQVRSVPARNVVPEQSASA